MCYLMTTFRCPSEILIISRLFTARWSTWSGPGDFQITCSIEMSDLVIFNEEMVGGWERVITDKERVLLVGWRKNVLKVYMLMLNCQRLKVKGKGAYSSLWNSPQNYGTPLTNGITQCYLPPDRGDHPRWSEAFTQTGQVGTRFIDPVRMKGWVVWIALTWRPLCEFFVPSIITVNETILTKI